MDTGLLPATAPIEYSSTPPLKTDNSDIADDDVCELDELKIPMTPITNKRLKLLIENKMGENFSRYYLPVADGFARGNRIAQA
jgi:hypothetical protein